MYHTGIIDQHRWLTTLFHNFIHGESHIITFRYVAGIRCNLFMIHTCTCHVN